MKDRSNSTRSGVSEVQETRSGFISIIGVPNAGKSTLLNALMGHKVSIATPRPNTTRNRIVAVLSRGDSQMVFLDTPGVHHAVGAFDRQMVSLAVATIVDADIVLIMIDATMGVMDIDRAMIKKVKGKRKSSIAVINKVDLVEDKAKILPLMEDLAAEHEFDAILPVSALKNEGVDELMREMDKLLMKGPMYYPLDMSTEYTDEFFASEVIREVLLNLLREEVPHSAAVTVKGIDERPDCVHVIAGIHVEKNSQKGIVIGRGGAMLKEIGTRSRKALEKAFGEKVYLELKVGVEKNWRKDPKAWRKLKYD